MDKRKFLQTSSAIMAGTFISGLTSCAPGKEHLTNWAGNLQYSTDQVHYPTTVEELQEIIKKFSKLRALGSQHSFNSIADSKENLVSSKYLNKIISFDKNANTVKLEGGIK